MGGKAWSEEESLCLKTLWDQHIPIGVLAKVFGRTEAAVRRRLSKIDDSEFPMIIGKDLVAVKRIIKTFKRRAGVKKVRVLNTRHPDIYWLKYRWIETMARKKCRYVGGELPCMRHNCVKRLSRMAEINREEPLNTEERAIFNEALNVLNDSYARRDGMLNLTSNIMKSAELAIYS